jgi:hypothetical protein
MHSHDDNDNTDTPDEALHHPIRLDSARARQHALVAAWLRELMRK